MKAAAGPVFRFRAAGFLEITLVHEGRPAPNARYILHLADGTERISHRPATPGLS